MISSLPDLSSQMTSPLSIAPGGALSSSSVAALAGLAAMAAVAAAIVTKKRPALDMSSRRRTGRRIPCLMASAPCIAHRSVYPVADLGERLPSWSAPVHDHRPAIAAGKSARFTSQGCSSSCLALRFFPRLHLPSQARKKLVLGKFFWTPSRSADNRNRPADCSGRAGRIRKAERLGQLRHLVVALECAPDRRSRCRRPGRRCPRSGPRRNSRPSGRHGSGA